MPGILVDTKQALSHPEPHTPDFYSHLTGRNAQVAQQIVSASEKVLAVELDDLPCGRRELTLESCPLTSTWAL